MHSVLAFVLFSGLFIWTFNTTSALDVSKVSENVTDKELAKREAKVKSDDFKSRFYPEWVPFKKNIEELGELVPVKQKPKKRLALPLNYILNTAAENDDFNDKDASNLSNQDEVEKKDLSDLNQSSPEINKDKSEEKMIEQVSDSSEKLSEEKIKTESESKERQSTDESNISREKKQDSSDEKDTKKKEDKEEEEEEEEEDPAVREAREKKELEEKAKAKVQKEKVLKEVDQLKERHAQEQRLINERDKEEFERDVFLSGKRNNYNKYDENVKKQKDYDDYEDITPKHKDKYPINTSPKSKYRQTSDKTDIKPTRRGARRINQKRKTKKVSNYDEIKKSSYDTGNNYDNFGQKTPKKYVESEEIYVTDPPVELSSLSNDNARISLIQEQETTVEPTSYYPKKRRLNRRRRPRVRTTPEPDASVAETIEDKASTVATELVPTVADVLPSANEQIVKDTITASSDHKKEGGGNHEHKKGGGKEHHSEHHSEEEEHGKKAYQAHHEDTKSAKGHHDKEAHKGKYDDKGGHDKYHHHEDGHYGSHKHEEAGRKHAKYEESGKHSKGHSTKGSHNIHKKDEYEKKVEFFEEEGDSGEEEKHGGFKEDKEHASGGKYKKANLKAHHNEQGHGKSGLFEKGGHLDVHKGHKLAGGHDSHGKHGHGHENHGHKESGKKWIYHHGHPAKTANLVVIDRRLDRFNHGPVMFYG